MKKRTDHDELLADVLGETASEEFRSATLDRGLAEIRRLRRRRRGLVLATLLVAPLILAATLWLPRNHLAPENERTRAVEITDAKKIGGTPIRLIGDDQLLALFQGRPVALIGPPDNRRLLLLDERRN